MIKPDGVQRGLVGQIIARFEAKGYKMIAMKVSLKAVLFYHELSALWTLLTFDILFGIVSSPPLERSTWSFIMLI
jgi:nucleoside-diphosphate kinase